MCIKLADTVYKFYRILDINIRKLEQPILFMFYSDTTRALRASTVEALWRLNTIALQLAGRTSAFIVGPVIQRQT